ncbi:DUF1036 domain-containing protein [Geitlerinema sp. P-1104]|uniref:DUF1036 domain-containing protein n=1 Tax=Geitlerinema sp. P-1104 TaxID=2546230 RepID=UPI001476B303|nr:DUF1036 domain-containing protein [Geitlerinema sp. P-1104]
MLNKDFLIKTLGSVSIFCAGLVAFPEASEARLRICNHTLAPVTVAVGYPTEVRVGRRSILGRSRTITRWDSRGWWTLNPRQCQTVVSGLLRHRYYYLYAESERRGRRRVWDGNSQFCVRNEAFTAHGTNCSSGYRAQGFRRIDTGPLARSFRYNLTQRSWDD